MIIGISGKIGSGKDTVGKIIQVLSHLKQHESYGGKNEDIFNPKNWTWERALGLDGTFGFAYPENGGWEIKKFADKLKDATCLIIGCTRQQLEDQDFKNRPLGEEWRLPNSEEILTPRKILQLLGTDCGRDIIHPDIWVNSTFSEYKSMYIGDWGQGHHMYEKPNWIITDVRFPNEAEAIKERDGLLIRINRNNPNSSSNHASETSLDDYPNFHYTIDNNGTIQELVQKVRTILEKSKLL